jgi:hypothetical protein
MYSTTTPYLEIKPARAAPTSFAVQVVEEKLVKEAVRAVRPSSGLHATAKKKDGQRIEWADIGAATVSRVAEVIRLHQPLTWHYTMCLAQPKSCSTKPGMATAVRTTHPNASIIATCFVCLSMSGASRDVLPPKVCTTVRPLHVNTD